MKCPICEIELLIGEKTGIEIDYCPKCRGIWLDRGELEKIIERTNEHFSLPNQQTYRNSSHHDDYDDKKHYNNEKYSHEHERHDSGNSGYKKKGFLGELFDF